MATLWIGQDYLINKSVIDSNVDYTKITPVIELVQDKYMLPILGTDLYNAIDTALQAYIDSNTTIPARFQTIIDQYILKALTYYILAEASDTFKYRYANKGILEKTGSESTTVDNMALQRLIDKWENNAELYVNQLIKYLRFYSSTYPEYSSISTGQFKILPATDAFDVPLYMGESFPQRRNPNEG